MRNAEYWKKMLPVIQAFTEGKTVQYMFRGKWMDATPDHELTFYSSPYRIKPEPQIVYINLYPGECYGCHPTAERANAAAFIDIKEKAVPFIRMEDSSDA